MTNFSVGEMGGPTQGTHRVKSGVVDNSGATLYQGKAAAYRTMGNAMNALFSGIGAGIQQQRQSQVNLGRSNLLQGLNKIAQQADQNPRLRASAGTQARALYQSYLRDNPNDVDWAQSKFSTYSSNSGKRVMADTAEQKVFKADMEAAIDAGWINPSDPIEKQNEGFVRYQQQKIAIHNMENQMKRMDFETKKLDFDDRLGKQAANKMLDDLGKTTIPLYRMKYERMLDEFNKAGGIKNPEAMADFQQKSNALYEEWSTQATQIGAMGGDDQIFNRYNKLFELYRDNFNKVAAGTMDLEAAQTSNKLAKELVTQNILEENPQAIRIVAANEILKNVQPADRVDLLPLLTGDLENMSKTKKLMDPDQTPKQKRAVGIYLKNFGKGVDAYNNAKGEDKLAQEKILLDTSKGVLNSLYKNERSINNPSDLNDVAGWLANPKTKQFFDQHRDKFTDQEMSQAQEVIQKFYRDEAIPVIEREWLEKTKINLGIPEGMQYGIDSEDELPTLQDQIEVKWDSHGISFVPLNKNNAMAASAAKDFNENMGPLVNKVVRMQATLSGEDPKAIFEEAFGSVFDAKVDEKETKLDADKLKGNDYQESVKGSQVEDDLKDYTNDITNYWSEEEASTGRGNPIYDVLGHAEGTDKGRGYNETLGYGKFTGGDVDLVNMTLGEVRELGKEMLKHEDNNLNSSALGRYQIVNKTRDMLQKRLGLSDNVKYTKEVQDRMAAELLEVRGLSDYVDGKISKGQLIDNLSKEWASVPSSSGKGHYSGAKTKRATVKDISKAIDAYIAGDLPMSEAEEVQARMVPVDGGEEAPIKFNNKGQEKNVNPRFQSAVAQGAAAAGWGEVEVISGYRGARHNKLVGGGKGSRHTHGDAFDINIHGKSTEQIKQLIRELNRRGVTRFITYSTTKNMLHVDMGRLGVGGKNAHFMFNKSARHMAKAPKWYQEIAKEIE